MPGHIGWKEKLTAAKEAGYDGVELSVDESDERLSRLDWSAAQRLDLLRISRETDVRFPSLCLSGHRRYPLGSRDPETVRRGMTIFEKAVRLAGDLGIRLIQLAGLVVFCVASVGGVSIELYALVSLAFIWLYDGRRGYCSRPIQWLCYAFYPVHLLLLWLYARTVDGIWYLT